MSTSSMAWSFRRGDWFGVFGPRAAVVLPPSERSRVAALWELVDDGGGFDETLDALISSGLRALTGFVLVSTEGDVTRVVIRGAARAHLAVGDEVLHVEGDAATTWVERSVPGMTRIRIEVDGEADALDGLVDTGLVRLACAEHPPAEVAPTAEEPRSVEAEIDHDGLTRYPATEPVELLGPPAPGIPGQPPAPPVTARPVARLVFSDGETVPVDRTVLVGRAPEPARSTTDDAPRLVSVTSPHHEVSSTHLEIKPGAGADHGAAVVTDLGSTNGTVVVQPGLPPEDLRPGVTVQLVPGALVDLGDGVTIEVRDP
ncbi:FHA domain-containing protein [Nocardioides sp. YIM 152315]|uniref:FHA domain-containing protein n=1 Tax=Nocardioides sp. YIM 152315 TaxID=3031760 RepID=UPI0023DA18D5|nr:FHA domain-containing protein [Nocardioides sp. YIM 152315]MDF1604831.1 FHA domain-containing protein [Nocardioides sp. YIM 152315]